MQEVTPELTLNNRRTINGWALFDWANSSYALVIAVAIFPIYFIDVTSDTIEFWGMTISNTSVYSFSVATAYIILVFLSPLLSGISDSSGRKMVFLKLKILKTALIL